MKWLLPCLLSLSFLEDPEIFVCDDVSGDGAESLCECLGVHYIPCYSRSYAFALVKGLTAAYEGDSDYFIQLDGDGSHDPSGVHPIFNALSEGCDVVLGIRSDKKQVYGFFDRQRSVVASFLAKRILGLPFNDLTTGFHGFSRRAIEVLKPLAWKSRGFEVQVEIVYRSYRKNLKVKEVPILFVNRRYGCSKKKLAEPLVFVKSLFDMKRLT